MHSCKHNHNKVSSDALTQSHEKKKCNYQYVWTAGILHSPNCLMSNIKGGCFILKHNQRGSFFSLIASQARRGKFVTNLFQPDELHFRDRDGKWLERNGWGSPWLSASLKDAFRVVEGKHLGEKKKENAVSFNCAKPAWKTSAWITATVHHMGILAVRHKFRHTNRNTCAPCIWIPSQGREGGFQNLFICRFPRVGLMKNSKYMDNKRVCVFFLTFRLIRWRYMKAVCFWQQLMPSLSAALPTSVAFDYVDFQGARAR